MKKFFDKQPLTLLLNGIIAAATAILLTSCPPDPNAQNTGSGVNIVNDPEALSQYVKNYKSQSKSNAPLLQNRTREEWSMPDLSQFTPDYQLIYGTWPDMNSGGTYVVPAGTTYTAEWGLNLNANNTHRIDLIVLGKLVVLANGMNINADIANVYVGPNGEIDDQSRDWQGKPFNFLTTSQKSLYLYKGSRVNIPLNSYNGAKLYVEGGINVGDVEFGGPTYIGENVVANSVVTNNANFHAANVTAQSWTFNNDSQVDVEYNINIANDVTINAQNVAIECQELTAGGNFKMENNSCLNAYQHIDVQGNFDLSTQGIVYTPCLYVRDNLYVKNCGTLNVPNYIYCGAFEASASGFTIAMGGNALFRSNTTFTIQNKNWTIRFNNDEDNQSAIVAQKIQIMEGEAAYIYGYAYLSAAEYWGKPSENFRYYLEGDDYRNYTLQETVKATINGVTVKTDADNCTPSFEFPEGIAEPPVITELISSINHVHDISATCVALYNGKAYLSWHKRGTSIHGCLEALEVVNDIAQLTSWMEVNDGDVEGGDNWGGNSAVSGADENGEHQGQFDFNHLIVVDGKVVTVGDNAKMGGFIGSIDLDASGNFGTQGSVSDAFKSRQLLGKVKQKVGRSGNAVVYEDGKYYIACAGGFQEYEGDLDDLFVKENNRWKASLGDYELTDGSAKHIAINPAGDKVATLEFTEHSTVNEGDDYWFNDVTTALNAKLKVRSTDNWLNSYEWEANIGNIAPIYGKNAIVMDADGNVYVSAGKQGLLVYNNGALVNSFSIANEYPKAGVNGVAIDNNYVYIAYGIGGLWILNKSDLSVVSWYKSNAPEGRSTAAAAASANYVALDGEYIYVAYGRHGVKVLKLED